MSTLCDQFADRWAEMLPHVAHAYNTSYHRSIDETPFFLMFGRDPQHFDFHIDQKVSDNTETVRETFNRVQRARSLVRDKLAEESRKNKQYYDQVVARFYQNRAFEVGHLVWLSTEKPAENAERTASNPTGRIAKLAPKFVGPYRITEIRGYVATVIPLTRPTWKPRQVHFDRMKPCLFDDTVGDVDPERLLEPFGADPAIEPEAE